MEIQCLDKMPPGPITFYSYFTTIKHLSLKIIVCVCCAHMYVNPLTGVCAHMYWPEVNISCLPPPYFSRAGFLTNLESTILASLADPEALRIWPSPPHHMGCGGQLAGVLHHTQPYKWIWTQILMFAWLPDLQTTVGVLLFLFSLL